MPGANRVNPLDSFSKEALPFRRAPPHDHSGDIRLGIVLVAGAQRLMVSRTVPMPGPLTPGIPDFPRYGSSSLPCPWIPFSTVSNRAKSGFDTPSQAELALPRIALGVADIAGAAVVDAERGYSLFFRRKNPPIGGLS